MIRAYITAIVLLSAIGSAGAQGYSRRSEHPDQVDKALLEKEKAREKVPKEYNHYIFASWDGNKPLSNKDFISQQSLQGLKLGFRKRLNDVDNWWVGIDYNWSVYKQHIPTMTYTSTGTSASQSVTTDLFNYSYNYGLTVNMDYSVVPADKIIAPYIGLGIGAVNNTYKQFYNIYSVSSNEWGLLVRTEAGVLIGYKVNSPWRLKAAAHYDYASAKSSDFNYKSFSNLGLQLGLVRMLK